MMTATTTAVQAALSLVGVGRPAGPGAAASAWSPGSDVGTSVAGGGRSGSFAVITWDYARCPAPQPPFRRFPIVEAMTA